MNDDGVFYEQKIGCEISNSRGCLIEWMMGDCVYRVEGDCEIVVKVSDEMGTSDYIGVVEMDI